MNDEVKTRKGTVIRRYRRFGVGKKVGDDLYLHRDYVGCLSQPYRMAFSTAQWAFQNARLGWDFTCVKINLKTLAVRLDEAPDFDTAREPHIGEWFWYSQAPKIMMGHSWNIWHHKWLWVMDDYRGFSVQDSIRWSREYLPLIAGTPKASDRTWARQLEAMTIPRA